MSPMLELLGTALGVPGLAHPTASGGSASWAAAWQPYPPAPDPGRHGPADADADADADFDRRMHPAGRGAAYAAAAGAGGISGTAGAARGGPGGPSPLGPVLGTLSRSVRTQWGMLVRAAPLTATHIAAGCTLYVAHLTGLLRLRSLLFHPGLLTLTRRAGLQAWLAHAHRPLAAFLVLGDSLWDLLCRVMGLIYWQAPLEARLRADRADEEALAAATHPRAAAAQREAERTAPFWRRWMNNPLLRAQLISAGVIVALEIALQGRPRPAALALRGVAVPAAAAANATAAASMPVTRYILYPYALYPTLEHAMRWLWAMLDDRPFVLFFSTIPVPPILLPLLLTLFAGRGGSWGGLGTMTKGAVAAVFAASALNLRRRSGERVDGWVSDGVCRAARFLSGLAGIPLPAPAKTRYPHDDAAAARAREPASVAGVMDAVYRRAIRMASPNVE
ncbi:hypothetical protein CXG81DRAFT_27867 [Caulochytrium protostelioides]|nr:hypothetical protein CXG81DRAFT_27867 [Caulochytrium protostelioides]|eukprot:RKO99360.1 hypothetical protein CXG81DRAFT_27867 [Caulochytrium protostelioides]